MNFEVDKFNLLEFIGCMNILNDEHEFKLSVSQSAINDNWFFCIDVRPKNRNCQWDIFVRIIGKDFKRCEKEFYDIINKNLNRIFNYDVTQNKMFGFLRFIKIIEE